MACQTAGVAYHEAYWAIAASKAPAEYHEAFWVVVGTAAPVLMLAAVVSYNQTLALALEARRARRKEVAASRRGGARRRILLAAFVVTASMGMELAVFLFALISLAAETDSMAVRTALVLTGTGFFYLFLAGVLILLERLHLNATPGGGAARRVLGGST